MAGVSVRVQSIGNLGDENYIKTFGCCSLGTYPTERSGQRSVENAPETGLSIVGVGATADVIVD
jgi:hypothetical protein